MRLILISVAFTAVAASQASVRDIYSRGKSHFAAEIALAHTSADNTISGISEGLFDNFKLFANFTGAAYCPNNEESTTATGTLITCPGTNCTQVEADNVTAIVEFGGS